MGKSREPVVQVLVKTQNLHNFAYQIFKLVPQEISHVRHVGTKVLNYCLRPRSYQTLCCLSAKTSIYDYQLVDYEMAEQFFL